MTPAPAAAAKNTNTVMEETKSAFLMKRFNVTGLCVPEEDYMVDISGKIAQIKQLIDRGSYFTINRARQYGKTTTLNELEKRLSHEYTVISISFEGLGDESFLSPEKFCPAFVRKIVKALRYPSVNIEEDYIEEWADSNVDDFDLLSAHITKMCRNKKMVLMIDEVDRTSNNRVFLQFVGMLRDKFLARKNGKDFTFHSVILAGVYDIKNIKLKLINEGLYTPAATENKIYNSPWNIAVNFEVDMSFNPTEIATMLKEYEADHKTEMNIAEIAEEIYRYTSGYPFLVSRMCQCIEEELDKEWTQEGIQKTVTIMLVEQNTLFDDMFKNIKSYSDLSDFLYELLFVGEEKNFNTDNSVVNLGAMFGFLKNSGGKTKVANRIFEIRIYNYFADSSKIKRPLNGVLKYDVVKNGRFDMELCLLKFADYYAEIYSENDLKFLERHGRLLFLSYLRPLINGEGFYHIESGFTDLRRMDIVVDYGHEQFIIELKIWRGEKHEEDAQKQLLNYMETKNADTGYLLTFDFRKESSKDHKAGWTEFNDKKIFDIII
jgi:hypothetical protein